MFLGMSWLYGLGLMVLTSPCEGRMGWKAVRLCDPRAGCDPLGLRARASAIPLCTLLPEQRDYIAIPPVGNLLFCEESCSLARQNKDAEKEIMFLGSSEITSDGKSLRGFFSSEALLN